MSFKNKTEVKTIPSSSIYDDLRHLNTRGSCGQTSIKHKVYVKLVEMSMSVFGDKLKYWTN